MTLMFCYLISIHNCSMRISWQYLSRRTLRSTFRISLVSLFAGIWLCFPHSMILLDFSGWVWCTDWLQWFLGIDLWYFWVWGHMFSWISISLCGIDQKDFAIVCHLYFCEAKLSSFLEWKSFIPPGEASAGVYNTCTLWNTLTLSCIGAFLILVCLWLALLCEFPKMSPHIEVIAFCCLTGMSQHICRVWPDDGGHVDPADLEQLLRWGIWVSHEAEEVSRPKFSTNLFSDMFAVQLFCGEHLNSSQS